jgi:3-methylcrotonyl-CoA carboxylase alpha subunit
VRLYAEDPERGFLPGSGRLERLFLPQASDNVRLDGGVVEGDTVTIFYDPMIAKLIVWDEDRPRALARLREALADCDIVGPKSNIEFLEKLIRHPVVIEGRIDTGYLDRHLDEVLPVAIRPDDDLLAAAAAACLLHDEQATRSAARDSGDPYSPWAIADGWRLGHAGQRVLRLGWREHGIDLVAHGSAGRYEIELEGRRVAVDQATLVNGRLGAQIAGRACRMRCRVDADRVFLHDGDQRLTLARLPPFHLGDADLVGGGDRVLAPMPGRIVLLRVVVGDIVEEGQELGVMEAMKMELGLKAPRAGVIAEVRVADGDFVDGDALLILMEAP